MRLVCSQRVYRTPKIRRRKIWLLEINASESVDLKVEEAGHD